MESIYIISRRIVILWAPALPWISTSCRTPIQRSPALQSSVHHQSRPGSFPVLLDIERPLELQVGVVVIIDEFGEGFVVAAADHARRGGFGFNY